MQIVQTIYIVNVQCRQALAAQGADKVGGILTDQTGMADIQARGKPFVV